jgi:hypothetical protein
MDEAEAKILAGIILDRYAEVRSKKLLKIVADELVAIANVYAERKAKSQLSLDGELYQVSKIFETVYRDVASKLMRLAQ